MADTPSGAAPIRSLRQERCAVDPPIAGAPLALSAEDLWFSYQRRRGRSGGVRGANSGSAVPAAVVRGVSVEILQGEFLALVGTNGCGKSTVLQLLAGLLQPQLGIVRLQADDGSVVLSNLSTRDIARRMAIMHQMLPPMPGVSVRQLVEQGRYPHRGALGMLARGSGAEVAEAIDAVGLGALTDRGVDELSGGERQRARLALALAQQPSILLLDEPTAHLDVRHQLEMLELVERLRSERGLTVVVVLHDLDHTARFCSRIVALRNGEVAAVGSPSEVLTPQSLADIFGVHGRVVRDDLDGRLRCLLDAPIRDSPSW